MSSVGLSEHLFRQATKLALPRCSVHNTANGGAVMANEELVPRKLVVEKYIRYDARKKKGVVPTDMTDWDWSSADDLDRRLDSAGFKTGIIAGYTFWKPISLPQSDLANCAVEIAIFPGLPRALGQLVGLPQFETWKPPGNKEWFQRLNGGGDYPKEWPLILRPAVRIEHPAKWYVEDGSGRAICFFRRLIRTSDDTSRAHGYLGVRPDAGSTFMRTKFPELLY